MKVSSGVSQGSVLESLLFLIYVNALPKGKDSYLNIFGDDSRIMREVKSEEDCISLQRDLDKHQICSATWIMKFNPSICKVMRMGHSERQIFLSFSRK